MERPSPAQLDLATFSGLSGAPFRAHAGPGIVVDLGLAEVTALTGRTKGGAALGREVPFSLLFRGPMQPFLPQGVYTFENDALGSIEIFIVPIGPDREGHRYEAIFH